MGLRVWLPLNGSLENQGLSNVTFTNNGAATNANGKIGGCYSFNGSSNYLKATYNFYSSQYTVSAWVYTTSTSATQNIVCDRTSVGSGFAIFLIGGKLRIDSGGNNLQWTTNYTFPANTWFHLTIIYDGTDTSYYINGVFQEKKAHTISSSYWGNTTSVGSSQANGTNWGNFLNGRLNDVRIYDHALSVKEVREVARGLMVHYKLDSTDIEAATNYLTAAQSCAASTQLTYGEWVASLSPATCTCGNYVITYSAYIRNTSSVRSAVRCSPIKVGSGYDTFVGNYLAPGEEGWSSITCDLTDTTKYTGQVYCYFANGSGGSVPEEKYIWVKHVQIERNNHRTKWTLGGTTRAASMRITDLSGFKYHGSTMNSLQSLSDTPRYSRSISFPGTSYIKRTSPSAQAMTISLWAKWNSIPSGQSVIYVDYKSKTGLGLMSTGILCSSSGLQSYTFSKSNIVANTWYHFVIVCPNGSSNAARNLYINGIKQTATSNQSNWSYAIDELQLGKRSTTSDGFNGKLSDFRIYATALSDADILDLYNESAAIDRNGNYYSREVIEK